MDLPIRDVGKVHLPYHKIQESMEVVKSLLPISSIKMLLGMP
jgi:hypothetical protein